MTKSFTILLTVVTIAVLLFACEKKDVECTSNAAKKSDYLQLPEDFNLCNPSMADLRILSLGFERLPIDAFGKVDFAKSSAEKMNMSQGLFELFVCFFPHDQSTTPRIRRKLESEFTGNDCVARAISWCVDKYRPGSSYQDIQTFCLLNYGINGVPVENLTDVLNKFTTYKRLVYSDLTYGDVITFKVTKEIGHTAIFVGRNGDTISYMTPNGENSVPRTARLDDLRDCIRVTGAKNF